MSSRRCPHCGSSALHVACVKCNRDMCEDCISYGEAGKVCGLCKDREDAYRKWHKLQTSNALRGMEFDEWYDRFG